MINFESNVCGIPCIIRVIHYEPYRPAYVAGAPENCYPEEGGHSEWEVLDRRGSHAAWLERKINAQERSRINDEVDKQLKNL